MKLQDSSRNTGGVGGRRLKFASHLVNARCIYIFKKIFESITQSKSFDVILELNQVPFAEVTSPNPEEDMDMVAYAYKVQSLRT